MNEQHANQLFEQAIEALKAGKASDAERTLKKLDAAIPSHPGIIYYLAVASSLLGRKEKAISLYDRVIRLHPQFVEAYNNKGLDLNHLGMHREAVNEFKKAIEVRQDFVEAHHNLGVSLNALGQFDDALVSFQHALNLRPNHSETLSNIGGALVSLKRFAEAEAALRMAIGFNNADAKAYFNLGVLLTELNRYDGAKEAFAKSLEVDPNAAATYENLGALYSAQRDYGEAIKAYEKALECDPNLKWMQGLLVHTKMKTCNWHDYDPSVAQLLSMINSHKNAATPFTLLGLPSSRATQKSCAEDFVNAEFPVDKLALKPPATTQFHKRVKIAYISSDYYNHATLHLMSDLFGLHDREKFEIIGICYGHPSQDELRIHATKKFDQFIEVYGKTDYQISEIIRSLEIDIAIDLKGHTGNSRLGFFAMRPAPIQAHYLGYPGSTGAKFIDYLIADSTLIPQEHQVDYSEKIVYLPDSYQANSEAKDIERVTDKRTDHGLPEHAFVFCCFNNNWKITPDIFNVWMRILDQVENSVLWLLKENPVAADNLTKEATSRGIDPNRVIFADILPIDQHLSRHQHADLFLDTIYCNAHTTASDSLKAGLPILTILGETFAGRVAASLLNAMGLPELIANNMDEYERLAIELARSQSTLNLYKQKIVTNRQNAPLFNTARFTRNLENAYEQMMAKYQRGLPPDHIYVS